MVEVTVSILQEMCKLIQDDVDVLRTESGVANSVTFDSCSPSGMLVAQWGPPSLDSNRRR